MAEEYILRAETAKVGEGTEIQHGAIIADGVVVGADCFIGYFANIGMKCMIEDDVYIGAQVILLSTKRVAFRRNYSPEIKGVKVCQGARIIAGAIIMPGITIGKNALVGAGSIVTKDVPAREIFFGSPANKRGNVPPNEFVKGGD